MRIALLFAALAFSRIAAAACDIDVTPPGNLQQFYPTGSIRREEKGAVVVEFTVEFGRRHPVDAKVVTGSGFPYLDAAAAKIAQAFDVRTECLNGTARRTVHFEKEPNPPMHGDVGFAGDTYIWVED